MPDPVRVVVHLADGRQCARCRRYAPEVDQDPLFAETCARCSATLHTLFYDLAHGRRHALPESLRAMSEVTFSATYLRPAQAGRTWAETQDLRSR